MPQDDERLTISDDDEVLEPEDMPITDSGSIFDDTPTPPETHVEEVRVAEPEMNAKTVCAKCLKEWVPPKAKKGDKPRVMCDDCENPPALPLIFSAPLKRAKKSVKRDYTIDDLAEFLEHAGTPTAGFLQNVAKAGVLYPIILFTRDNGYKRMVDGIRRLKAAKAAGLTTIMAEVYDVTGLTKEQEDLLANGVVLTTNNQRHANAVVELEALERLLKVLPIKEIADQLDIPLATLRKRARLLDLAPPFRAALTDGKIPVTVAEGLLKLPASVRATLEPMAGSLTHAMLHEARSKKALDPTALPSRLFTTDHPKGEGVNDLRKAAAEALHKLSRHFASHAHMAAAQEWRGIANRLEEDMQSTTEAM